MQRIPEPELMDDEAQARAYASADFEQAHSLLMEHFTRCLSNVPTGGAWIDLGCGDADITSRLAKLLPKACIDAVDGAAAMLAYAKARLIRDGVDKQVRLIHAPLADIPVDAHNYDGILSTSLLHHLHKPQLLWKTIKMLARNNARVFVADLYRPQNEQQVAQFVARYAATEAAILQRDFRNSLRAAFTPREIKNQLLEADLGHLHTRVIDDRHIIVYGRIRQQTAVS